MHLYKRLFVTPVFYISLTAIVILFIFSHFFSPVFIAAKTALILLGALIITDFALLISIYKHIGAKRLVPDKLSNGDENIIRIIVKNSSSIPVKISIIDELPFQLQVRDFYISSQLHSGVEKSFVYNTVPKERGEYWFGAVNVFISTQLQLLSFRLKFDESVMVPVYPSIIQMRKFELFTMSDRLSEAGVKRVRKLGHTMEFDQIRRYVKGDDYRTINWKATARKTELMVNQYEDEKSQPVYCAIDMGRAMKMPFNGMTLLDYAINSSLILANVSIRKQDKAGIITFSDRIDALLPARKKYGQMQSILEILYNQKTHFMESSYEQLYAAATKRLKHSSLLFLFTNFETLSALKRQLHYLQGIAKRHLLTVIFFKNTELEETLNKTVKTTEELYIQTIAEKFDFEKKQIIFELRRYGINNILTTPDNLTINTINKYLEIKSRGII
jgi:uncharacterized protein (DUF58 family)